MARSHFVKKAYCGNCEMNKQPFYHATEADLSEKDLARIKSHPDVILESVEYCNRELLFTATREITANELGIKTDYGLEAEPGDPCDLM